MLVIDLDLLNPWSYHFIGFNGQAVDDYLARIGLSASSPISSCENGKKIEACFEYILESVNHPKSADLQAISGFYALIGTLCDHTEPQIPRIQTISRQADYIRQAIEYIETIIHVKSQLRKSQIMLESTEST